MKFIKRMTVTALATVTVFGSFFESVEAASRGSGNEASFSREEAVGLDFEFTLFSLSPAGFSRLDRDFNQNNRIGIFPDSIEEFTGSFTDFGNDFFAGFENEDCFLVVNLSFCSLADAKNPIFHPLTLDLTAKLIPASDSIEYILTSGELEEQGITEIALIIEKLSSFDGLSHIKNQNKAVNSLEFIIENQLLSQVNLIRISGISPNSSEIVSKFLESTDIEVKPIHESSSKNSLLVVGIVGLGFGLKSQIK